MFTRAGGCRGNDVVEEQMPLVKRVISSGEAYRAAAVLIEKVRAGDDLILVASLMATSLLLRPDRVLVIDKTIQLRSLGLAEEGSVPNPLRRNFR